MVAVNVTFVPAQILLSDAVMFIVGVTEEFTVIVILFEFAVLDVTQLSLDVNVQVTTSPSAKLEFE